MFFGGKYIQYTGLNKYALPYSTNGLDLKGMQSLFFKDVIVYPV